MNKTNNRIREEKLNTLKSMLWELGHTDKDAHHIIEYVDELLKSQREDLVEKIEKMIKIVNYQLGGFFIEEESYNEAIKDILYLIKNN